MQQNALCPIMPRICKTPIMPQIMPLCPSIMARTLVRPAQLALRRGGVMVLILRHAVYYDRTSASYHVWGQRA